MPTCSQIARYQLLPELLSEAAPAPPATGRRNKVGERSEICGSLLASSSFRRANFSDAARWQLSESVQKEAPPREEERNKRSARALARSFASARPAKFSRFPKIQASKRRKRSKIPKKSSELKRESKESGEGRRAGEGAGPPRAGSRRHRAASPSEEPPGAWSRHRQRSWELFSQQKKTREELPPKKKRREERGEEKRDKRGGDCSAHPWAQALAELPWRAAAGFPDT